MDNDRQEKRISPNISALFLLAASLLMIFGGAIYYIYALNALGVIISLALSATAFFLLAPRLFRHFEWKISVAGIIESGREMITNRRGELMLILSYLAFVALAFYVLTSSVSNHALISPWQVVDKGFFWLYAIASVLLLIIIIKGEVGRQAKLRLLSLHYLLSFIIAAIVYRLGYGFDPFVHQATMELIDKKGAVDPKPVYYLGQYALIVIIHKLSACPIFLLNKLLVPVLAAIFLPGAIYRLAGHYWRADEQEDKRLLVPFFGLIIGFSPFILSTPQNLSYLWLIITLAFGLAKSGLIWPLVLALATAAIHPLTGIPALGWWLLLAFDRYRKKLPKRPAKAIAIFLPLMNALALPLALFLGGGAGLKNFSWSFSSLLAPLANVFAGMGGAGEEGWLLNLVYFFADNYSLWLTLALIAGVIALWRRHPGERTKSLLSISFSLIIAYLISSQIAFRDLISYEQGNFSGRLLVLIVIFLSPALISGLQGLIEKIAKQDRVSRTIWVIFGLGLLVASLYVSYPRFDRHFNSRGYSTGDNDVRAVNLIDQEADGNYIVLANQQVSAAALSQLGFDHYYESSTGPLYFYPIPTGGLLYDYYLDMVYEAPERATMEEAMALAGVSESYLVVNRYWNLSARIIAAAKLSADSWQSVGGNEVFIFRYLRQD